MIPWKLTHIIPSRGPRPPPPSHSVVSMDGGKVGTHIMKLSIVIALLGDDFQIYVLRHGLMGTTGSYVSGVNSAGWSVSFRQNYAIILSFDNGSSNQYTEYRFEKSDWRSDTWYHIAFVRSSNVIKAYLDGVYYASSVTVNN